LTQVNLRQEQLRRTRPEPYQWVTLFGPSAFPMDPDDSAEIDLVADFDLTPWNTMGLRARAQFGTVITERDQLLALADRAQADDVALNIVGQGSNLLLRPQIDGIVAIMATRGVSIDQSQPDAVLVTAQAGENWHQLVERTVTDGLPGLENLASIPGTVGAAPVQNIGAYGLELADRFHSLLALDLVERRIRRFDGPQCDFAYRNSVFKASDGRYVVLEVTLALPRNWQPVLGYAGLRDLPPDSTAETIMREVMAIRASKLPDWRVEGNAGSFFHNPVVPAAVADAIEGGPRFPHPDGVKLSAAWLIDACGFKGHRHGNAGVSERHALVLVNRGGATYAEIAGLAAEIREAVQTRFGVTLTQEPLEF
jgi:UDP-N-acetylmuramate dehydrogenase